MWEILSFFSVMLIVLCFCLIVWAIMEKKWWWLVWTLLANMALVVFCLHSFSRENENKMIESLNKCVIELGGTVMVSGISAQDMFILRPMERILNYT